MNFIWTPSPAAEAIPDRNQTDASCVTCPMCSCEVPLAGSPRLPREFSALCPNCGHRKVYLQAEAHNRKPDVAAAKAPRKIQFGKKTSMQPRSMAG